MPDPTPEARAARVLRKCASKLPSETREHLAQLIASQIRNAVRADRARTITTRPPRPSPPLLTQQRAHDLYAALHDRRGHALPYLDAIPVLADTLAAAEQAAAERMRAACVDRLQVVFGLACRQGRAVTMTEIVDQVRDLPLP